MKKRILSLALVVAMLCTMLPILPLTADAATELSATPYPEVEYGFTNETPTGTIRYIAQNRESEYFSWNYWPTASFGAYGSPEYECGTACISMALSYVGVNRTPKTLLEATDGVTADMWGQQGTATSRSISRSTSAISSAMDDYINGNGKYSPLCIYIVPFSETSSMHWVLLVGKLGDNTYLALNPWHTSGTNGTFTIQINGETATYYGTTNPISAVNQWYNPDATIVDTQTPGKPVLNTEFHDNQVTFTWKETEHTTHYNIWLAKKDAAGDWQSEEQIFYAESGLSRTLTAGEYRAQLLSYNSEAWESDHSDWLHTWADDVFFTIEGEKTITYYDATGNVWLTENGKSGADHTLSANYPKRSGSYFSGWAYTQDADIFQVRPGETIQVTDNVSLYPLFVTHEQAISGEDTYIYNIADFTEPGYNIEEVEHTIEDRIDTSYWTDWSEYSTTAVSSSDTVEVRTTAMYRYYYFLCPSCGAHEPFKGTSDCGGNIPDGTWHEKWSEIPYSQSNYKSFSYTAARYYTESLGDGQLWIFGAANLNDTAIGTIDAYGNVEIISTGYSSRTYVEQYDTASKKVIAYRITKAAPVLSRMEVSSLPAKTVYQLGESLDITGLKLKLTYSDGSSKTITSGFTTSGFDSSAAGEKIVTVSYGGKNATFPVTVEKNTEVDPDAPQIVVERVNARAGETVSVNVRVKNNPGISSAAIEIVYDAGCLKLDSAVFGDAFNNGAFTNYNLPYATLVRSGDVTEDGVFLVLTFTVLDTADVGDSNVTIDFKDGDITNSNEEEVALTVSGGGVSIVNYIPGDINDDGVVNTKDLTRLLKYISHEAVSVNTYALDVNGDGAVNTKDLTRLLKYISHEDVKIY